MCLCHVPKLMEVFLLTFLSLLVQAIYCGMERMLEYVNFVVIGSVILFEHVLLDLSMIKLSSNQTLPRLKF